MRGRETDRQVETDRQRDRHRQTDIDRDRVRQRETLLYKNRDF